MSCRNRESSGDSPQFDNGASWKTPVQFIIALTYNTYIYICTYLHICTRANTTDIYIYIHMYVYHPRNSDGVPSFQLLRTLRGDDAHITGFEHGGPRSDLGLVFTRKTRYKGVMHRG